jgi:RNase_H superfamily
MNFISFDIETDRLPDTMNAFRSGVDPVPGLKIVCAGTSMIFDGFQDTQLWWGEGQLGGLGGAYTKRMSQRGAKDLVNFLYERYKNGYRIITVNGASFDWPILAYQSGEHDKCRQVCLAHTDLCFIVIATKAHRLGLDAIAKGYGLQGKTEGMNGSLASEMWDCGEYENVLEYQANDASLTLNCATSLMHSGEIRWTSKTGKPNSVKVEGLPTVLECLQWPDPEIPSWMTTPTHKKDAIKWLLG